MCQKVNKFSKNVKNFRTFLRIYSLLEILLIFICYSEFQQYFISRFLIHSTDHEKFTIEHIRLVVTLNVTDSNFVMPSSAISKSLLALKSADFTFGEVNCDNEYALNALSCW